MGIGVSYTGYDGKTRNAVVQGSAELPSFMGNTRRPQPKAAKAPNVGDVFKSGGMGDPVDGPLIGIEGNGRLEPDGQSRAVGSRGGWRIPITRTEMKIRPSLEMKCNEVILAKLQYDLIISEKGLVKGRTEEREVWRKTFFVQAEGEASGEYEVRPEWTKLPGDEQTPRLAALYFGKGKDLKGKIEEVEKHKDVVKVPVFTHGELT